VETKAMSKKKTTAARKVDRGILRLRLSQLRGQEEILLERRLLLWFLR
jgi:hypothetical protein